MTENNINKKNDIFFHQKIISKNIDNSVIIAKHSNHKNSHISNKNSSQINLEENNFPKNKKTGFISPIQKSTFNKLKTSKTFSKNDSNNSSKVIFPKHTKLKLSLTLNSTSSTQNIIPQNKIIATNSSNKNKNNENKKNNSDKSNNSKRFKMNLSNKINKTKAINSKENKKNDKEKKIMNTENDIFNFNTEECDENINANDINNNSRKHYSLTNPSIPSIPFANPFNYKNNNINNITDNNGKKVKHVRSLNIDNNCDLKKKQMYLEKNYLENLDIINVFQDNYSNEATNKEDEEDVKLNISNLDVDLNQIEEDLEEKNTHKIYKNSFIQFNNNLSLKLAAEKAKNTSSYMLALCPKLFLTKNKKDFIKENYSVNEPISEEVDSDSKTPKNKYSFFEENNTKYSTKDKYSERNNKNNQDFESDDNSSNDNYRKNTLNNEINNEKKNNRNTYIKKNKKFIKENNSKENNNENKNNSMIKKKEIVKKKINLNEILIETQQIGNAIINKEGKNVKSKRDNNISPKNISSHYSNNNINQIMYCETENNLIKNKNNKIKNQNFIDLSIDKKHQKTKSFLPNNNLNTLFLYETIQNNSSTIYIQLNSYNKKKMPKINYKSNDYRNKILNKDKRIIDNLNKKENTFKTPEKSKLNNNYNKTNRNSYYKDNENKNIYQTSNSNKKINHNKNNLKKMALVKSPKSKANPFLSEFPENNEKPIYNNDLNNTSNNIEFKHKNYFNLLKKKNNISKKPNSNNDYNNLEISRTNESSKNIIKDTNNMTHQKKISQQFIDEFNFMLEFKTDNNETLKHNNKLKILNQKLISKNNSKKNNKNLKASNKIKSEKCNDLKKSLFNIPYHKKNKTFFISPSYVSRKNKITNNNSKQFYKRINNINREDKNSNEFNTTLQMTNSTIRRNNRKKINNNTEKNKNNYRKMLDRNDAKKLNNTIRGKNKFKEIKKVIGENTAFKAIHKKTNTMGNTDSLSFLCKNLFNYNNLIQSNNQNLYKSNNYINSLSNNNIGINKYNQHKKALSINNLMNNLDNKKKIICAMQRIKFIPVSYYSKAIKEMTQINGNLLVILVYKDENQRFVFRGLYEVNEKDPQFAKKIFGQNCELNVLNINNINNFYNYSLSRGDFIKYKLLDEKIKKFNDDIVLVF